MGKSARIKLLGDGYDKPQDTPNALQLKKERQQKNKKIDDMLSNSGFWSRLGLQVAPDGSLREP